MKARIVSLIVVFALSLFLFAAADVGAVTYYVSSPDGSDLNDGLTPETAFATIQHGINTAGNADTILVYPGIYTEAINFRGKAITVQGVVGDTGAPVLQNPGDTTVSFYYGEGPNSVLKNFIVTNSSPAFFIAGSSPTIANLTIVNNQFGIESYGEAYPDICNCIFYNNAEGDTFGCEAHYSWDQQPPNGDLISHWKLDEGADSTAFDSSGDNDGTVYGAGWVPGVLDGALHFDGIDDYVALPDNSPVWLPQDDFTLSAWVYFERPPGDGEVILDLGFEDTSLCQSGYAVRRQQE